MTCVRWIIQCLSLYSIALNNTADTVAYILWQIHRGRYNARYTVPDEDTHSLGLIHSTRDTAVDIQQWIYSSRYSS